MLSCIKTNIILISLIKTKMRSSFFILVLLFSPSIVLTSCGYKTTKLPNNGTIASKIDISKLSLNYQTIRTEVFQNYCFKCHSQAGGNKNGINLESYASTLNADIFTIRNAITTDFMPQNNSLPPNIKTLLVAWIDAGAPENGNEVIGNQPPPATGQPTNPCPSDNTQENSDIKIQKRHHHENENENGDKNNDEKNANQDDKCNPTSNESPIRSDQVDSIAADLY